MQRPACRHCTARRGITGPVACYLSPHQVTCPRHRLWTGPSARTHAGQLDISQLPEISRARRRHLAQLQRHHWRHVNDAITDAAIAICHAPCTATPGPRPSNSACTSSAPAPGSQPSHGHAWHGQRATPGNPAIEVAIYPDVVHLAVRALRAREHQQRQAS
jgi:hypothetical protein